MTCTAEELLALPMSMVEEQAKELGVDAARGANNGGQERDAMIVSEGMLILITFSSAASRSGLLMSAGCETFISELGEGRT
jgi:hypothetical protein